ncbi:MAG: hypothetical protein ACJ763_03815 [Bdellovibrionia bacterium]
MTRILSWTLGMLTVLVSVSGYSSEKPAASSCIAASLEESLSRPLLSINVIAGSASEAKVAEVVMDAKRAAAFAEKYFTFPSKLDLYVPELTGRNGSIYEMPQYNPSLERITSPYLYGFKQDGKVISKGRRHSQTIFNHEFGHFIFRHNSGTQEDWLKMFYKGRRDSLEQMGYISENDFRAIVSSYDELFADVFAVAISKNAQAIFSAEDFTLRPALESAGYPADIISKVRKARNFAAPLDVDSWTATDPHIRLGPARSAFVHHSYAAHLLKTDPQRLTKLVFDAIQSELNALTGPEILRLPTLTVPEQNKRMINAMRRILDEDAYRN